MAGGSCWKETPSWHGAPRGAPDGHHHQGRHPKRVGGDRDRQVGHRQRNGNFHPRKGASYQDKFPNEERKDGKDDKLKFVEEDFVSREIYADSSDFNMSAATRSDTLMLT